MTTPTIAPVLINLVVARFEGAPDDVIGRAVGVAAPVVRQTFEGFATALALYLELHGLPVDPAAGREMTIHPTVASHVVRHALAGDPIAALDVELGEAGSAARTISAIVHQLRAEPPAPPVPAPAETMTTLGSNEELADLGPAPWTPGNGVMAEDVIRYLLPILNDRARGQSYSTIAATWDVSAPWVAALMVRTARAIIHDVEAQGFVTDEVALDAQAREDAYRRSDA